MRGGWSFGKDPFSCWKETEEEPEITSISWLPLRERDSAFQKIRARVVKLLI